MLNDKKKDPHHESSESSGLYRVPGGGIEGKECLFEAGARAALEESGYEVELGPCMAMTEERRGDLHLTCFCCRAELFEDGTKKIFERRGIQRMVLSTNGFLLKPYFNS